MEVIEVQSNLVSIDFELDLESDKETYHADCARSRAMENDP